MKSKQQDIIIYQILIQILLQVFYFIKLRVKGKLE
jgi:hypothetical protein